MISNVHLKLAFFLMVVFFGQACQKAPDYESADEAPIYEPGGVLVLNEGLFNKNNSSLTYFNPFTGSSTTDVFEQINQRGLGDTGNDIKVYGSKIYIAVNVSSTVEVLEASSGKSLTQLLLVNGPRNKEPREITPYGPDVYIACFDGTVAVLDTATLKITQVIEVGKNPDGIAISDGKLYISNSGGLDYPNFDSTLSVVDLLTLTEINRITVGLNPGKLVADESHHLFAISRGNYTDVASRLQKINTLTDQVERSFDDLPATGMAYNTGLLYLFTGGVGSEGSGIPINIKILETATDQIVNENFISDGTLIQTPYQIDINPATKDVYLADARGFTNMGEVLCFSQQGQLKFKVPCGLNPGHFAFL